MSNPTNVTVNVSAAPSVIMMRRKTNPIVQLLWFLAVGWWAAALAVCLAYLLILTILGIPLGIALLNKIPGIIALRDPGQPIQFLNAPTSQRNFFVRMLWFVLIGSWLAAIWMSLAYLVCITILGLPLGLWMFDKAPAVLTLRRS